jgi:hypothetical protein
MKPAVYLLRLSVVGWELGGKKGEAFSPEIIVNYINSFLHGWYYNTEPMY